MKRLRAAVGILIFIIIFTAMLYYIPFGRARIEGAKTSETFNESLYITTENGVERWGLNTGKRKEIVNLEQEVTSLASGDRLFMGTDEGKILVQDESSSQLSTHLEFDSSINELQKSDKLYALIGDKRIVGIENGEITTDHSDQSSIGGFCVSPNGKKIAVWNSAKGIYILEENNRTSLSEDKNVTDCSFSKDGKLAIAYKSGIEIYDTTNLDHIFEKQSEGTDRRVGFTNSGQTLVLSNKHSFQLYDLETETRMKKEDVEDTINDLDSDDKGFTVTTDQRVYFFDSKGELQNRIQRPPKVPQFLPLVALGVAGIGILAIWSEFARRNIDKENFHFIEKKLPYDEAILLGTLGILGMTSFVLYLFIRQEILISFGFWMTPLFLSIFWIMLLVYLIVRPRRVKLDKQNFHFSTSIYQENFKGWLRKAKLNRIKAVHPDYFYNKAQENFDQIGFQAVTIDGDVGKITFTPNSRESNIRELKKAMKKVFDSRWDRVYIDKPYFDEDRWKEVKHLADKSLKLMSVKMMLVISPILVLNVAAKFFIDFFPSDTFLPIIGITGAFVLFGSLYLMNRLRKIKEAQSLQAKRRINPNQTSSYTSLGKKDEKEKKGPKKYLDYTTKDWIEVQKKLKRGRPLAYSAFGLMVLLFISAAVAVATNYLALLLIVALIPVPLIIIVFYLYSISKARNIVKNAVEHQLKTGENVLPEGFEIPDSPMGEVISREPIEVTEKEKRIKERWTDEMNSVKVGILVSFIVFMPMGVILFAPDLFDNAYGDLLLAGSLFIPMLIFIGYSFRIGKIVRKVKEAERLEMLLEEREGD